MTTAPQTFELREPGSVDEALALLGDRAEDVRPIAGGTALMLVMRYGYFWPETLVSLRRLVAELGGISSDPGGDLRIGATTTLRELEASDIIAARVPAMVGALRQLANVRVRNVATIGGHLCHGDPHMDLPPLLMALDARVRVASLRGPRWVPVADLYTGYYETVVADDELLTEVVIPAERCEADTAYLKFSARSTDDWPTLGVAVGGMRDGGRLSGVRLAVGAVGDRVSRVAAAESLLEGQQPSEELFGHVAATSATAIVGDGDAYMAELVRVQVRRALAAALGGGGRPDP